MKNSVFVVQSETKSHVRTSLEHNLEKYALSDAIALSVKLGIWEWKLERFTENIEHLSEDLNQRKKLDLKLEDVLQKLGYLFTMRHMVNINSNFLDTPDFYWVMKLI